MIIEKYVKVGERGQIAIPKEIREMSNLEPKQIVKVLGIDHEIMIKPLRREKKPEHKILEFIKKAKLTDKDWEEIKKERER